MQQLAAFLSMSTGRMVLNKTGLQGVYDFTLSWTPGDSQSIIPAVQEQLGLQLNPQTAPIEKLIIDSAEKPSTDSAQAPSQPQSQLNAAQAPPSSSSIDRKQPDKVLLARAKEAMKDARYAEARGLCQTLIQSYPNSEYVPLAKLSIALAWHAEGNLKRAEVEYRDFLVFFPNRPEIAEVQSKLASIQEEKKSLR
jgi:TolA-binding protein